jgi:prepilin signal peptidase PulO-like enzyme (type II secretory pathway)
VLIGFIALPMPLRILLIALLALLVARFINWAIYSWAYNHRRLGPWSNPPLASSQSRKKNAPQAFPARSWADHLPIIGWYRLRAEGAVFGKWYWIRPLLIELIFPVAIAWYYHFYVSGQVLQIGPAARGLAPELHWQFSAHLILFTLMSIGTFIDFDEQSIPDYVTLPGTVIGIVGAALAPAWLPFYITKGGGTLELNAALPNAWPGWLDGPLGLLCGLLIIAVWGFALLERRLIFRRGLSKAFQYFLARMFRNAILWKTVVSVTAALALFTACAWYWQIPRWQILLSSLLGLAFAGGVTWGVRISASYGLGVEALGFGDVTLMAMIGTYIGWQPSLLVFFIAPMVAIIFVLIRTLITGKVDTPYGPYLCGATVLLLVYWDAIWTKWAAPVFALGGIIIGIVVACVVLMGAMLWIWQLIKQGLGLARH